LISSVFATAVATALGMAWWVQNQAVMQPKPIVVNPQPALPSLASNISTAAATQTAASNEGTQAMRESEAWATKKRRDNAAAVAPNVVASIPSTIAQIPEAPSPTVAPSDSVPATRVKNSGAPAIASVPKRFSTQKLTKKRAFGHLKKPAPALDKKDRGEEIDRLKTQAFSETKKDRIDKATTPANPSEPTDQFSPLSTKQNSFREKRRTPIATRDAYGQCQRNANLFQREQCKWQVCSGKWGKHGCPSYDRVESSIF
jgi:hypothetical protein